MKHDDRIDRALEGLLPTDELAAFQADVIRDAELRAAYVDRAWLHASLRAQRETLPELLQSAPPEKVLRRWPVIVWTSALAACVTLVATFAGVAWFRRPVATLVQA